MEKELGGLGELSVLAVVLTFRREREEEWVEKGLSWWCSGKFGKASKEPLNPSHQLEELKALRGRSNLASCNAQPLSGSTQRRGGLVLMEWWSPKHST